MTDFDEDLAADILEASIDALSGNYQGSLRHLFKAGMRLKDQAKDPHDRLLDAMFEGEGVHPAPRPSPQPSHAEQPLPCTCTTCGTKAPPGTLRCARCGGVSFLEPAPPR